MRKKLIEVALPLEAINAASAREKSIRHGHPSTLHLWWARRPLAAARAVLFAQLVDDPSSWPELFPSEEAQNQERQRLFQIIEDLVQWENSNNETVVNSARLEIARSHARSSSSPHAKAILAQSVTPEVVREYLATELPPVHDPFAGGGTIPLEAQRLGLRAIASDLNPVAAMINKALIEIPPRFSGMPPLNPEARHNAKLKTWQGAEGLAEDVRYYGAWLRDEAKKRIGDLYADIEITPDIAGDRDDLASRVGETVRPIAWLWARTVRSPDPAVGGLHVPLVSSFWLSTKPGKSVWVEPRVRRDKRSYEFVVQTGSSPRSDEHISLGTRTGKAEDFRCILSGSPISREYIREEGKADRLGQRLMAVATVSPRHRGRLYLSPSDALAHGAIAAERDPRVQEARGGFLSGSLPTRAMITGGVCSAYGLDTWGALFSARQLVALLTLSELVPDVRKRVTSDVQQDIARNETEGVDPGAYGDAVATYLGFIISRLANYASTLCVWSSHPKDELTKQVFLRQALPMTWDFSESNPFASSGGTLDSCIDFTARAIAFLHPAADGTAFQGDARKADFSGAIVATDPPYFDNISYAELSDFFYVWLRRSLQPIHSDLFRTLLTPKQDELIAAPSRHGGREQAETFFKTAIQEVLAHVAEAGAVTANPSTIFYAFKQSETSGEGTSSTGWEAFLQAVYDAGLGIVGTWPIRTELVAALKKNVGALASSIVLVCRRRDPTAPQVTRADFRRALRAELPRALHLLQQGNIAPVDVAQAAIGPGFALFSTYRFVSESDGAPMTVRGALRLINEVLDEYLASGEGDFDPDTRFAITWYEQHGWEAGQFGDAETLAKARNVSVAGVVEAGICHRTASQVRILKRHEMRPLDYDPQDDKTPTVWEFTQHMIRYLEEEGEERAARLLKRLGSSADATRELAYRLFNTCERKKWADDARSYNALILAWPELEKLAAKIGDEPPPAVAPSKPGTKKGKKAKSSKKQQELFDGDEE